MSDESKSLESFLACVINTKESEVMYDINVENIIGVKSIRVQIDKGKIVIVCGNNSQGKSSFLNACRAVFAAHPDPARIGGLKQRAAYINERAEMGIARVKTAYGERWFKPGTDPIGETNQPPICNPAAVGIVDLFAPPSHQARSEMWEEILGGGDDIPKEILSDKIAEVMFKCKYVDIKDEKDRRQCDNTINIILHEGWDKAQEEYRQMGVEAKKDWRDAVASVDTKNAGAYGATKADLWKPPLADIEDLNLLPSEAQTYLDEAEQVYEGAIAMEAARMVVENRAAAEDQTQNIKDLQAEHTKQVKAVQSIRDKESKLEKKIVKETKTRDKIDEELNQLESKLMDQEAKTWEGAEGIIYCPKCNEQLVLIDQHIHLLEEQAEIQKEAELKIADLKKEIDSVKMKLNKASSDLEGSLKEQADLRLEGKEIDQTIRRINDKIDHLKGIVEAKGEAVRIDDSIPTQAEAKVRLEKARQIYDNVIAMTKATDAHRRAKYCQAIKIHLQASGIRHEYLKPSVEQIRKICSLFCKLCGWREIGISEGDYSITYGGRAIKLCSTSEQWRTHAIIQIAIALVTKSEVAIIDEANLLSQENYTLFLKKGLEPLIEQTKLTVFIGETGEKMKKEWTESRYDICKIFKGA